MSIKVLIRDLRQLLHEEQDLHVWLVVWRCIVGKLRVAELVVDFLECHREIVGSLTLKFS